MSVVLKRTLLCLSLSLLLLVQGGCSYARRLTLSDEMQEAQERFSQGEYMVARALYERLAQNTSDNLVRQKMMLQMGKCYFNEQVRDFHDARMTYLQYIETYPNGQYVAEARQCLAEIDNAQKQRNHQAEVKLDQVAQEIETIKAAIQADPQNSNLYNNADLHLKLGNALWRLQRYDEARDAYVRGCELNAALRENATLRERLTTDAAGRIVPVTPERRSEIEHERQPLVVFNDNAYKSRLNSDHDSVREVYYNVTGLIRNQSARDLHGVVLEVRFFNPNHDLMDTQNISIGDIGPGGVRTFLARATSYDNLYNIVRYECYFRYNP
ncbi:MAG TPA: tetratricopeptide repeat protein [Candidatus Sumerlaeota bacterium]|nr:tetratricopeptide repeat protein [Candidatus Sumerlaeota bacterium]